MTFIIEQFIKKGDTIYWVTADGQVHTYVFDYLTFDDSVDDYHNIAVYDISGALIGYCDEFAFNKYIFLDEVTAKAKASKFSSHTLIGYQYI